MPVEGFRNHVVTDGSLLGVSGRWSACGWSVVQLDHDEEMGPMRGMHGTLDAEVQRTIKKAELTASLCLFKSTVGPTTAHVDTKGIINGFRRGDMKCSGPEGCRSVDFDLGGAQPLPSRSITVGRVRQGASLRGGEAGNVALRTLCHGRQ